MSLTARGGGGNYNTGVDYLTRIEESVLTGTNQKVRLAPIAEMRAKFSQTALDKIKVSESK